MKTSQIPIDERNQLIDDLLAAAKGEEVSISDIAWFLQMDPFYANCWMRKYNNGKWINGKNVLYWKQSPDPDQRESQ